MKPVGMPAPPGTAELGHGRLPPLNLRVDLGERAASGVAFDVHHQVLAASSARSASPKLPWCSSGSAARP